MRRTVDFKRKQKVIVVDDKYEHASGVRELVNLENDYEFTTTFYLKTIGSFGS